MKNLLASRQLSIYLSLISLIISGAMMRPSFTTLVVALPVNALVLYLLRRVAHWEGRADHNTKDSA